MKILKLPMKLGSHGVNKLNSIRTTSIWALQTSKLVEVVLRLKHIKLKPDSGKTMGSPVNKETVETR